MNSLSMTLLLLILSASLAWAQDRPTPHEPRPIGIGTSPAGGGVGVGVGEPGGAAGTGSGSAGGGVTGPSTGAGAPPPVVIGGFPFPVGYGLPRGSFGLPRGPRRPTGGSARPRIPPRRPVAGKGTGRVTVMGGRLPFADDRWENWWLFNQDRYLDMDRRYAARARVIEMNGDTFLGAVPSFDPASPLARHRAWVRHRVAPLASSFLSHSTAAVRAEAALALGKSAGVSAIPVLVKSTSDRSRLVRRSALLALGHTGDPAALRPLIRVLLSRERQLAERHAAAVALGLLGRPEGLQALLSAFKETGRDRSLAAASLFSMGFIPGDDALLVLRGVIDHRGEQAGLRGIATLAMAKQRDQSLIPLLLQLLQDRQTHVRRSAALGLGAQIYDSLLWERRNTLLDLERKWRERGTLSGAALRRFQDHLAAIEMRASIQSRDLLHIKRRVVDLLSHAAYKDNDLITRLFATMSLGRLGGPEAQRALLALLRKAPRSSGKASFTALALAIAEARGAASTLRLHLIRSHVPSSARSALCIALGLLGDVESGPVLLDLALSRVSEVKPSAAIGCGLMNYGPAIPEFRAFLKGRGPAYLRPVFGLSLGLLGDHRAIEGLHELLAGRGSTTTRVQAAQALGTLRDVASVKALAQTLESVDLSDMARAQLLRALGQAAEKTPLPALEVMRRDWNYLLPFPRMHQALLR